MRWRLRTSISCGYSNMDMCSSPYSHVAPIVEHYEITVDFVTTIQTDIQDVILAGYLTGPENSVFLQYVGVCTRCFAPIQTSVLVHMSTTLPSSSPPHWGSNRSMVNPTK